MWIIPDVNFKMHDSLSLLLKAIMILLLALGIWSFIRRKAKKAVLGIDPAIAEANARERYRWRYARWVWQTIQYICLLYLVASAIKFILS